jgi:hypothetical protein
MDEDYYEEEEFEDEEVEEDRDLLKEMTGWSLR